MSKPTIVYLHGLNCSSKIFNHLYSQLPDHTPYFIDYVSHQSIEMSYQNIVSKLPSKPFQLIGHSLGGVLGYLISTRTQTPLKKLITISSPFGGSAAASVLRWIYPDFQILKDIAPTSGVMKEIGNSTVKIPFLSLVSKSGGLPFMTGANDGVITLKSQKAVKPTHHVELNANHFEAVQDARAVSAIKEFLF